MLRAPKSKEGYAAIGGGSPLRKITDEQVGDAASMPHVLFSSLWSLLVSFVILRNQPCLRYDDVYFMHASVDLFG